MTRMKLAMLNSGVRASRKTASTCRSGNRGTRRETMPLKRVTVCAGTSWEKATRKDIWSAIVPLMVVKLGVGQLCFPGESTLQTYVQLSFPEGSIANRNTKAPKQAKLGISALITRNFANSWDVQARSRYLPP